MGDRNMPSGAEYAGAGVQLALTIVAFMFLGIWLDKRLGSSPWFVLLCVFVGAAGDAHRICPARDESARPLGPAGADQPRCLLLSLYATRTGVPSAMRTRSLLAAVALACTSGVTVSRPLSAQQAPAAEVH